MSKWTQADVDRANKKSERKPFIIAGDPIMEVLAVANVTPRAKGMNKTEQAYERYLWVLHRSREIAFYKFEAITIKLGHDCRFTPDFLVIGPAGEVQFHEVKGFWKKKGVVHVEDDARAKLSVAATTVLPFFEFRIVWQREGEWHHKIL